MKLTNLIWVLALAGAAVAGCNSGPVVTGCDPGDIVNSDGVCESGGGAGGSGTGGAGGAGEGACTNDADRAVYEDLVYQDGNDDPVMGSEAASAIASDCVFGSSDSTPPLTGCGDLALDVVTCAISMNCPPELVGQLTQCVVDCTQDAIEEITGSQLSAECSACYGDSVSCSAELCATNNCSTPDSAECVQCRCDEDCTPGFDRCSGLPPSGACG